VDLAAKKHHCFTTRVLRYTWSSLRIIARTHAFSHLLFQLQVTVLFILKLAQFYTEIQLHL